MPTNILNLPAYMVTAIRQDDHDYHIDAIARQEPTACPHCQHDKLERFGRRQQRVKDLPMRGRRVSIYIDTRRYRCKSCSRTFYETLPEINATRLMTNRLVAWIGQQTVKTTFSGIAEAVGVAEGTVRQIFKDYVCDLEKINRFETPIWMGIDEIPLIRPRAVISNIVDNTIVALLRSRTRDTMIRYLHHLEHKDQVQYVVMDMWQPYWDACQAVIPDARIVIDKFHVLHMVNDALERVRMRLRQSLTPKQRRGLTHDRFVLQKREHELSDGESLALSGWTRNYPELGVAYRLKEDFFGIYDVQSPDEAQGRYLRWKIGIPTDLDDVFASVVRAWENWNAGILGYFEHLVPSAYRENLHNLNRGMNCLGRGYSFEAMRAGILFQEGQCNHQATRLR